LGELRQLKISLPFSCDLEHRTNNVYTRESLVYRDGSQWWIRIVDKKKVSDLLLSIPNLCYDNNRYFYQYLEEWLLHYDYRNEQGETLSVPGLRSCLNPQHDYLFTLKNGQSHNSSSFGMFLKHSVGRVTGKCVSSVRRMFYTYAIGTNTIALADVENLARIMGHSMDHSITMTSRVHTTPSDKKPWAAEIATTPSDAKPLVAEIAQAFIDERCKRESPLHRVEVDL